MTGVGHTITVRVYKSLDDQQRWMQGVEVFKDMLTISHDDQKQDLFEQRVIFDILMEPSVVSVACGQTTNFS